DLIGNVDQVSVGSRHVCYLSAGAVYCWGANVAGNLGTGDTTPAVYPYHVTTNLPANVTQVAAGNDVTCALASGHVSCWGTLGIAADPLVDAGICNANYCLPAPEPVLAALPDGGSGSDSLANVAAIHLGYQFGCALDTAGALFCWGASGSATLNEAAPFVNS